MITTYIPEYTGTVPDRTQVTSPVDFANAVYNYKLWINSGLVPSVNEIVPQVNSTLSVMNGYYNTVNAKHSEVLTKHAEVLIYRNDALSAKQAIESYVVPTNVTYSPAEIDAKIQTANLEDFLGFNF